MAFHGQPCSRANGIAYEYGAKPVHVAHLDGLSGEFRHDVHSHSAGAPQSVMLCQAFRAVRETHSRSGVCVSTGP